MNIKIVMIGLLVSTTGVSYAGFELSSSYTTFYQTEPVLELSKNTTVPYNPGNDVAVDYRPELTESDYEGRNWLSRSKTSISSGASFTDFDGDSSVNFFDQEIIVRPPERDLYVREDLSRHSSVDRIKYTGLGFSNMTFGYFNDDNQADLIAYINGTLKVSYAENGYYGDWLTYVTLPAPMNELAFGDFDGDGLTDIFRADTDRQEWYVSYGRGDGTTSDWRLIKYNTEYSVDRLIFGSFTTPGKTDIGILFPGTYINHTLYPGRFSIHSGPAGNEWAKVIDITFIPEMQDIRCADLDNNGLTDMYFHSYYNDTYLGLNVLMDGSYFSDTNLDLYDATVLQHRVKNGDWDCDGRMDSFALFPPIIQ